MENGLVVLGRVTGAHALRGEIRVRFFGDGPESLMAVPRVSLAGEPESPDGRDFVVEDAGPGRGGEVRMRLRGVSDRSAAEALQGQWVRADVALLPSLPEGEWYWFQFVGCRVEDADGRRLGVVREIWETGAHDILVVEGDDGRRQLIPAAADLLKEVDIEGRRIAIEVVEGLLDPS